MPLNPDVSLRPALESDWPAVEALLRAHALPVDGARQHLPNYQLAVVGRDVVGCAGLEVYDDVALLRSVAVAPGRHRQGVGQRLVDRLLQQAAQRRVRRLFLLTTTASAYFTRRGFRPEPLSQAPAALKASAELQGACPASAEFMSLTLSG